MDHGHPDAAHYPLPMLMAEAELVVSRINTQMSTDAILTQLAVASGFGSTEAAKAFTKMIKEMNNGV